MRFSLSTAAFVLALTSCASAGGGAPSLIETTTFAATLDVDLSQTKVTPSGLYVREYSVGEGPAASFADLVRVRYTVSLADGTRIDGTGPDDPPFEFRLGQRQVIAAWEEGVTGMRAGGRRQLIIPPKLGYGPRRFGTIPPNSVMVVSLHVVSVRP